jgi:putative FmdB family regulatory protein
LPTYEYACTACGHRLEAVQRFTDDPLTECPECGAELRKVYGAVGIVLKGSGFYKTDSRAAAGNGSGQKGAEKPGGAETSTGDSTPKKESTSDSGATGTTKSEKSSSSKESAPASSTAG